MTATNSVESAKDGAGNAFNITFAAESISGHQAQKTYIGEPAGETIITPAQDGTDGTGIPAPTGGGVGIRGWLSGMHSKLAGTLAVSAASLPLPFSAATAALQTTINTTLGSPMQTTGGVVTVVGRTTASTQTPTVTSNGVYPAGNEVGGLMTFSVGGAGTGGLLTSVTVTSKSALSAQLVVYIFTANPSSSTWTDNAAPAINTADIAKALCGVPLNIFLSGLGTMTVWSAGVLGMQFSAANLYAIIVANGDMTLTSSSTSDFTVQLGMKVD